MQSNTLKRAPSIENYNTCDISMGFSFKYLNWSCLLSSVSQLWKVQKLRWLNFEVVVNMLSFSIYSFKKFFNWVLCDYSIGQYPLKCKCEDFTLWNVFLISRSRNIFVLVKFMDEEMTSCFVLSENFDVFKGRGGEMLCSWLMTLILVHAVLC